MTTPDQAPLVIKYCGKSEERAAVGAHSTALLLTQPDRTVPQSPPAQQNQVLVP